MATTAPTPSHRSSRAPRAASQNTIRRRQAGALVAAAALFLTAGEATGTTDIVPGFPGKDSPEHVTKQKVQEVKQGILVLKAGTIYRTSAEIGREDNIGGEFGNVAGKVPEGQELVVTNAVHKVGENKDDGSTWLGFLRPGVHSSDTKSQEDRDKATVWVNASLVSQEEHLDFYPVEGGNLVTAKPNQDGTWSVGPKNDASSMPGLAIMSDAGTFAQQLNAQPVAIQ